MVPGSAFGGTNGFALYYFIAPIFLLLRYINSFYDFKIFFSFLSISAII